jgi:hypothetical protein
MFVTFVALLSINHLELRYQKEPYTTLSEFFFLTLCSWFGLFVVMVCISLDMVEFVKEAEKTSKPIAKFFLLVEKVLGTKY